jgi:hypothetical protein
MARVLSFLGKEIQWGKVAGIAVGAAVLTMILSSGELNVLSLLTFSLGGILIERAAPRHPFWNGLVFGLLGIVFMMTLVQLLQFGRNQPLLTLAEMGWGVLSLSLYTMPQAMMGAWIGVTIRRAGEMARQKQEQKEQARGQAKGQPASRQADQEKGQPPPRSGRTAKGRPAQRSEARGRRGPAGGTQRSGKERKPKR